MFETKRLNFAKFNNSLMPKKEQIKFTCQDGYNLGDSCLEVDMDFRHKKFKVIEKKTISKTEDVPESVVKLFDNKVFMEFISEITNGIKDYVQETGHSSNFIYYFKDDLDDPSQKNLSLYINFIDIDDLGEKLSRSREVAAYLSIRINNLISNTRLEEREELKRYNAKFLVTIMRRK